MKLTEFPLKGLKEPSQLYRLIAGEVIPPSGKTSVVIGKAVALGENIGSIGYLDYHIQEQESEKTFVICNLGVEPPFPRLLPKAAKLNREIDGFVRNKGLNKILIENIKDDEKPWIGTALRLCGYDATKEGNAEKVL